MLETLDKYDTHPKTINNSIWGDELVTNYYTNYYDNLTSKQLDRQFNNDISSLVKTLSKLPEQDRKKLIEALSKVIEFYIEHKFEKELEFSFHKLLRF